MSIRDSVLTELQCALERVSGTTFSFPGRYNIVYDKGDNSRRHLMILSFFTLLGLVPNMKDTGFWSVTKVKCWLIRRCFHLRKASTIAYASFSTAVCFNSWPWRVLAMNATGRPFWLRLAEMAMLEASVSTVKGKCSSMAPRVASAREAFNELNDTRASWERGNAVALDKGWILSEYCGIQKA